MLHCNDALDIQPRTAAPTGVYMYAVIPLPILPSLNFHLGTPEVLRSDLGNSSIPGSSIDNSTTPNSGVSRVTSEETGIAGWKRWLLMGLTQNLSETPMARDIGEFSDDLWPYPFCLTKYL